MVVGVIMAFLSCWCACPWAALYAVRAGVVGVLPLGHPGAWGLWGMGLPHEMQALGMVVGG